MWDSRGRYYQHKRINGQPRRVYVGAGLIAELTAHGDALEQAQKAAQDAQRRLQRAQDRAILKDIDAQYRQLQAFVGALLTAAGYYQHNRGEWRRMDLKAFAQRYREAGEREEQAAALQAGKLAKGGGEAQPMTIADKTAETTEERARLEDAAAAELEALVKRVNGKNPTRADLDALRRVLDTHDGAVLSVIGGTAVLSHIFDKYNAGNAGAAARLVMEAEARRMGERLGRDSAPPFERPLIDHIVVCWVRLQLVERDQAANTSGAHNRESGAYWDRRLSEAQRRYLRAFNLLAKLRHMAPAVQVNIANQQVVQNG